MSFNDIILAVVALFPAVALCIFMYKKDKVEKEPIGLLLLLLGLGAIICFPVGWTELLMYKINDAVFMPFTTEVDGVNYLPTVPYYLYEISVNFICIALVEEAFKWAVLFLITHKNKNFNSLFDGLIYSVFVSLGFAALENIKYSFNYGLSTALARAVTAVPGHMFFGVIMGYFYTTWHLKRKCSEAELIYKNKGYIHNLKLQKFGKKELGLSLLMPVLGHGFYDFCCSIDSTFTTIGFIVLLAGLYIYCFGKVNRMSKKDKLENDIVTAMLFRIHPGLYEAIHANDIPRYSSNPFGGPSAGPFAKTSADTSTNPFANSSSDYTSNPFE